MIFTSVDLPAPFSPSSAWISAGQISRSMRVVGDEVAEELGDADRLEQRQSSAAAGLSGAGVGSSMRRSCRGDALPVRSRDGRAPHGLARDQQLRGDRGRDRGRRLVAGSRSARSGRRAGRCRSPPCPILRSCRGEARALGRAADQADIGKAVAPAAPRSTRSRSSAWLCVMTATKAPSGALREQAHRIAAA